MTEMTAQRFMQVADRFEGKSNIMLDFKPTVLYLLAAPSTPDEVVEKAQAKDASGQKVTVADVKEWKDKIHNLKKRHNKQQGTLETKLATLEFDLQKRADRNAELTKELQKLRFQTSWEIENTNLEKETAARAEEISKLKEENRRLQESLHEARRPTPAPKPNSDDHSKPGNVEIFVPQQPPISQGKQLEILLEQVQQDLRQPSTEIPHQVLEAMRKELLGTVTVIEEAISRLTYQPSHLGENV